MCEIIRGSFGEALFWLDLSKRLEYVRSVGYQEQSRPTCRGFAGFSRELIAALGFASPMRAIIQARAPVRRSYPRRSCRGVIGLSRDWRAKEVEVGGRKEVEEI